MMAIRDNNDHGHQHNRDGDNDHSHVHGHERDLDQGGIHRAMYPYSRGKSSPEYTRNPDDLPPGMDPPPSPPGGTGGGTGSDEAENENTDDVVRQESWLIEKARAIYSESTNYLDTNLANQWERNLSHFHGQHANWWWGGNGGPGPQGDLGRNKSSRRSRVFRPKTRANVKKQEAALSVAMFSTTDFAEVKPQNPNDPAQVLSAAVNKQLLQYRLSRQVPWFQTVQGAWQDTKNYGVCISYQYWSYEVDTDVVLELEDDGSPVMGDITDDAGVVTQVPMGSKRTRVRKDELCCDNIPPENFRFSPMCDWRNPAKTSPYLVYLIPMYVGDVLEQMEKEDPKTGRPSWNSYDIGQILSARRQSDDRTRQAREGDNRIDPAQVQRESMQTTVWVHMNVVRVDGDDLCWMTLGTELLLTEPELVHNLYPHLQPGERPFVVGFSTIETHRNYPAGDVEQVSGLQEEINLIANQRLDNVKLALNKRFYVRRGSQIDLDALIRNVPGGGVFMNDPEKDIKTESFQDVTGSSYQEQDRMSVEFDDLAGSISQESMSQTQGKPESVGKTNTISSGANMVQDYGITIFKTTWMEPVLRQLLKLIQMYETDEAILAIAGENVQIQKFGVDKLTDTILMQGLTLDVNVGMGNTDPVRRVERIVYGVSKVMEIPGMAERIKPSKLADEIMGSLGYRDSSIFFLTDDEAAKLAAENPPQPPPEIAVKMRELDIREADNNARHEKEAVDRETDKNLRMMELASKEGITFKQLQDNLDIEAMHNKTARDSVALKERNKLTEATLKPALSESPKPAAAPKPAAKPAKGPSK